MMRRRKKRTGNALIETDKKSKKLLEYWILTILMRLNGHRDFFNNMRGFKDNTLAYFLELDNYVDNFEISSKVEIMKVLERKLEKLEKINIQKLPKILRQNIQQISKLIGLNSVEKDILVFSIYLDYYDMLYNAARTLNDLSTEKAIVVLSVLLKHPASKIKKALSPRSKLSQSGMVSVDRNGSSSLGNKIDILSSEFSDKMMTLSDDVEEMIRDSVRKCEATTLKMNDYSYLDKDLNILIPYLQNALMKKEKGVNILFYGKPGTGKTELTKAIAKKLKVDIYEVSYADEDDEPISGARRLKAYKVGQSFFSNNNVILMFDEIEDVVGGNDAVSFFAPPKQQNKGWMNRMLENNPIPSIWITNDIYSMDSALVRRYDMAIEIPIPPKAKRKDIIKKECGDMLDEKTIDKIAANEAIAPALVSRAAKVVSGTGKIDNKDAAFENIINHTLKAQGYPKIQNNTEEALPESYDPSYINTDTNLEELAQGIKDYPNARICLYGVPGTGKSAFGKWIAQYTDRPFILKKGSDLISKWVGGTEQNIANAFSEAKEEGAVLVFDEVDSFLQDRRGAKNSWEVTQVNEMLMQMENFNGIFIATTNLMSGLDQASLRRFDIKLEFRYLKPKQAWKLFVEECRRLEITIEHGEEVKNRVKSLKNLTPGDFAAVIRQNRFRPMNHAKLFLERLQEELSVKEGSNEVKMGFL